MLIEDIIVKPIGLPILEERMLRVDILSPSYLEVSRKRQQDNHMIAIRMIQHHFTIEKFFHLWEEINPDQLSDELLKLYQADLELIFAIDKTEKRLYCRTDKNYPDLLFYWDRFDHHRRKKIILESYFFFEQVTKFFIEKKKLAVIQKKLEDRTEFIRNLRDQRKWIALPEFYHLYVEWCQGEGIQAKKLRQLVEVIPKTKLVDGQIFVSRNNYFQKQLNRKEVEKARKVRKILKLQRKEAGRKRLQEMLDRELDEIVIAREMYYLYD